MAAAGGLVTIKSHVGPKETMDRLVEAVSAQGMAMLARFDHARAAASVGFQIRPMEIAVFSYPEVGAPLIQDVPTLGIDLPLKALVWEDEDGTTWLSYNEPHWLAVRHQAIKGHEAVLGAMGTALAAVAAKATGAKA
jgi:uncharacterized protein (DUF302 family)